VNGTISQTVSQKHAHLIRRNGILDFSTRSSTVIWSHGAVYFQGSITVAAIPNIHMPLSRDHQPKRKPT